MDERAFYTECNVSRPIELNCPYCRTTETYELNWLVRRKRDRLPGNADERDRARFAKCQSYMVLLDDKVACKNLRCRKRFDVSGIKTTAFLSAEQEAALPPTREPSRPPQQGQRGGPPQGQRGGPSQGQRGGPSQGQRGGPSQGQRGGPSRGQRSGPSQGQQFESPLTKHAGGSGRKHRRPDQRWGRH